MSTEQLSKDLAEYGYTLDEDNQLLTPGGKATGAMVWFAKGGRLQVRNASGNLLWSGPRVGNFLESFWFAEKRAA